MAHCINKKSLDFKALLEQTNLDESTLSAHIAVWQEDNGLDKWPTPSDLGYAAKPIIKPGVNELFESNPELAQSVYEALGFKQTITQDNKSYYRGQIEEPTIDKDGNLVLYAKEDELYKRAGLKSKGVSMTDNLKSAIDYGNGQLEVAQNLASETYDSEKELQKLSDNGYYLIQIPKDISNEVVKEAGEVKIVGDKIIIPKGQYKIEQVIDGVESEITPQQKQEAQQFYSQYLSTIFPNSVIKDIVYHSTAFKFDNFDKQYLSKYDVGYYGKGFYFSTKPNKSYSDKSYHKQEVDGVILSVLVNLPNPNYKASNDFSDTGKDIVKDKGVVVIDENLDNELTEKTKTPYEFVKALLKLGKYDIDQIVVFEPEQIHILGSKKDIQGFKEFVENKGMLQQSSTSSTSPSAELDSKLQQFLNKIGVKIETLGEGDFVAKAKLVEKIIQVVQGKADISTLPEETAHFFVDLLKANGSGLFAKMMADITNHPIYQEVLEEYKDLYLMTDGTPDINRIKEEAVGKLIAKNIVKLYQNGLKANEESNKSLLDRVWNMIKAIIGKALNQVGVSNFSNLIKQVDSYEQAATKILTADVSDLNLDLDSSKYEMLQKTNTTQKAIIDAIDKSQNRIISDTKKVGVETRHIYKIDALTDKEKEIYGTPSTIASQSSRKKNKNRTVTDAQQKMWEMAANRGTLVHSWVEDITKNITSTSPIANTSLYDSLNSINKRHYDTLKSKVATFIAKIKEEQPGSIFRTEVKVYDPNYLWTDDYGKQQRGIAGSIDLLVIHPNGTVSIYDWKTTSKKRGVEEISIWKTYEYNMQVALYKRMLMDGNAYMGVPKVNGILKSRLIQINTEADVDGNLTKVQMIGDIPVAGESTNSKMLDSKLEVLYNRFYRLMNTKPPKDSVDRELFYSRIESLRDSIVSLHLRRNYDKVAEDADDDLAYVEDLLSKEDLNLDDVKIGLEVTDLYHDILDYMEDTTNVEVSTKMALLAKRAKSLRNKLLDKQGELMQELASSFGVGDISETQRQVSFLEKTFRAASGINHPLVASLYEMSKRALYEAEQQNNALRENIIKHQEVLKKWASAKGMNLQQAYDLIVDKKTGNLISKYNKDFWANRNKMDPTWMKENMEIDIDRYNKQLAYQEERIKDKVFARKPELDAKRKKEYIDDFKKIHSNVLTSAYIKVKPSKEAVWKSKEMANLEKPENKPLLDFYNFFSNTTKELSTWLPNFGWKPSFIPSIRTTWMENLSKLNGKTGTNLYHALISRIGVNELNTKANVDELSGEYGGKVPVYFTSGIEADKKSYDLGRVLQLYGEMSYNFKQMSEIETSALAGMEILQGQEAYERSSFNPLGVKISPMTQNPSKTKEANQGWIDMYKTFTNYYIYGIRTENPTKFTQMLDSLGQFTSFNLLGLNPMPAIAATVANLANTQIQIGRNIYFNNKQYAKSLWLLSGGRMGNTEQKEITYALLKLFEPHIDTRPQAKDRKLSTNIAVRNVTIDHFFAMLRNPDEINQNAVFLSMLQNSVFHNGKIVLKSDLAKELRPENYYHIPVKDRVPIDKAIAEKVKNTKSIMESCSIKDGKLHIEGVPEISTELVIAYRQMIRQVNKSIIGNMDPHDIATYKTNAYARSLMVFRNWMPRALEERYGELRYNRELGRHEWGRYNTFFKHMFTFQRDEANKLKWTAMLGVEEAAKLAYIKYINVRQDMADQLSEAEFIDLYKENMAAQYRGLAVTAGILLMLILGGRYMDDEDDLTPGEKYYAKIVRRAYSEMSMFINPVEALKILKSPTALTSPLSGIINVFTHSIKELGGAVFDVEDWQKNAHPLDKILRFSPLTGVERTYRIFDEQYEDWLNEVNQDD